MNTQFSPKDKPVLKNIKLKMNILF